MSDRNNSRSGSSEGYRPSRVENHTRMGRRPAKTGADRFGVVSMVILMACSIWLTANLMTLKMLPTKYFLLAVILLFVLNAAHVVVQIPLRRKKTSKVVCGVIALILSGAMVYGIVASTSLQSALKKISQSPQETNTIDVIVLKGSSAQTLADLKGQTFGVTKSMDANTLGAMKAKMSEEIGDVSTSSYQSISRLADGLYQGSVNAIIINDALLSSLSEMEEYSTFAQDTKIIYQYGAPVEKQVSATHEAIDVTKQPFIVYLSGSDSESGDINATGRSDVNILAVVNPSSHQIMLINTPRDYYVPMTVSNGVRDKLTHAGVYGIDCSMGTLAMLYGIDIPYYIRINFAGFKDIVNALGGVTVRSDYTFAAQGYQFTEGDNAVMGDAALAFVRERHSFAAGDNQRGRDQMAMIEAILKKAMSPAILTNYQSLLNAVSGSFTTNFSYNEMADFVQMQLSTGGGWNITSYAVTGTGDMTTTYTYPDENLYVMRPDTDTVSQAQTLIKQVMNGEVPQT
ncbi:MAG: LCP family protein [Oscillibacter sp.]|nr:LCP family protein [Oscillibacter sp.]